MAYEIIALALISALIGNIHGGIVHHHPVAAPVLAKVERLEAPAQYSFAYDVQDAFTGDSKAQFESRNGDFVQGSYSLIEADGTRRIVDYTADPVNGFNAVVNREPAVAAAPVVTKTVVESAPLVSAPLVATRVAAPVAAPLIRKAIHPAPIVAPVAAPVAAPVLSRTVAAAPIAAPYYNTVAAARYVAGPVAAPVPAARYVAAPVATARFVAAPVAAPVPAARVVAAGPVPAARVVAAGPVPAARVVAAAPVYQSYTLPRAVATRVGLPYTYAG